MNADSDTEEDLAQLVDSDASVPCYMHRDRDAQWRMTMRCCKTISVTICDNCQASVVEGVSSVTDACQVLHYWTDEPRLLELSSL